MQFEIATRVLKAMDLFTADGGRFANLFIDAEGDTLRIAATNKAVLALCRLQNGHGDEPLLRALTLEQGKTHEEMIFPAGFVLPGVKERECEYLRVDQAAPTQPIRVTLENGVCVTPPYHLHDEPFLRYGELIDKITVERLKDTSHLSVNPTWLKMIMDAAKKLGIENAHQLVLAMLQTDGSGDPGPLGIQVVNVGWFWVSAPQLGVPFYSEMGMPPAWAFGDFSEPITKPSSVSVKESAIIREQLALDLNGQQSGDPCTDHDPLLKIMLPEGEETEMRLSDMLRSADVEHFLQQLSTFHLQRAWMLDTAEMVLDNEAGLDVEVLLTEEAQRRGIELAPIEPPADDCTPTEQPVYRREECAQCEALQDGACLHGDTCILDEQQTIEPELAGEDNGMEWDSSIPTPDEGADDSVIGDPQGVFVTTTDTPGVECHGFGTLQAALAFRKDTPGHVWQVMNGQVEVWTLADADDDTYCWSPADDDFAAMLRASRG